MKNKKWFTLLELMIVFSIMIIILMFSFAPYNLYQNKAKLRIATREIAQTFYEAKNIAVSWIQEERDEENKSIWILLDSSDWKNNKIKYYYLDKVLNDKLEFKEQNFFKDKDLQKWIIIRSFWDQKAQWEMFFVYEAATWKVFVYENGNKLSDSFVKINLSYQKSDSRILNRTITYYLETNIVDYK